jgi:nitrite reductase/ring-hydroxylating ferredoxin subunit
MRQVVCRKDDIQLGNMIEATLDRLSLVVCRTKDDRYYAFLNRCIHQGAPLSKGKLCGAPAPTETVGEYRFEKEGEILRCPWHGREFDVKNEGRMLADPRCKLRSFSVAVEGDEVVVYKATSMEKGRMAT